MDEKREVQMQAYPGLPQPVGSQPIPGQPGMMYGQPGMPPDQYMGQPGMQPYMQPGMQPDMQPGMNPYMYQPGMVPGQPMVVQGQPVMGQPIPGQPIPSQPIPGQPTVSGQPAPTGQQTVIIQIGSEDVSGKGPYPHEQCCCCFEISCGVKTMGCLLIFGAIFSIYNFLRYLAIAGDFPDQFQVYIWVGFAASLSYCWPCYYYLKFFQNDQIETRNGVARAQFILIFLSAGIYIWSAAGPFILIGEAPGMGTQSSTTTYTYQYQDPYTGEYQTRTATKDNVQNNAAGAFIGGAVISLLINIGINYYYYMVAKRFAALHPGNEKYKLEGMSKLPC